MDSIDVLVIEDSPVVRSVVKKMLESDQNTTFVVSECEDLTSGISWLENNKMDAVILDLQLPESTGVETVSQVRQVGPEIPIVVFTGSENDAMAMAAIHCGADDYLVKTEVKQGALLRRTLLYTIEHKRAQIALNNYAREMERLAEQRAKQLLHQDRLATLGTMFAGVAHEINSPLAFISSSSKTLKDYWDTIGDCLEKCQEQGVGNQEDIADARADVPEVIHEIEDGVQRIMKIAQGLKKFARIDGEETQPVQLEEIVDNALLLCRNLLKYDVKVEKDFSASPDSICVQQQKIEQVFTNLINNAAQAMDCKGTLIIRSHTENDQIFITVEDTGPGIPADKLDTIWDPFFTTKSADIGTGLGLSICKDIINWHGGNITAENRDEGGARFTISLPISSGRGQ